MICILHGYLLEGSGSNLWTRSIIQSLCRQGETVHLFCQENHPELYDFIATVYYYDLDGSTKTTLQREVPYSGKCIMHKPAIGDTLPVYVWDKYEEFTDVQPMIQLSDNKIKNYLDNNIQALRKIVKEHHISVLHANHAVLMSVVAQRISDELSIPYAIMPHGSAIEYAVKKDKRIFDLALAAFDRAKLIFVIGKEIRQRVNKIFPGIKNLDAKMLDLNLGVDTSLFKPLTRDKKRQSIDLLCEALINVPRGKKPEMSAQLKKDIFPKIGKSELLKIMKENSKYNGKQTDYDIETRLKSVDWGNDKIMLFVGRLIGSKGIHLIISALPFIFQKHPQAKLIIVGHGPLREPLEVLLWALENGERELVENIVQWGTQLEGSDNNSFKEIEFYFEKLANESKLNEYFSAAKNNIRENRVIFTGYLTHKELQYLFPACDTAIFPSIVAEAGPLVFLESMASGCFPIGTYFAGMAASIDSISGAVPNTDLELMKISVNEKQTISDIVNKVQGALDVDENLKSVLHQVAYENYDWQNISTKLAQYLNPHYSSYF